MSKPDPREITEINRRMIADALKPPRKPVAEPEAVIESEDDAEPGNGAIVEEIASKAPARSRSRGGARTGASPEAEL